MVHLSNVKMVAGNIFSMPVDKKIHPRTSFFKNFAISNQGAVSISGKVIEPRIVK